MQLLSCQFAQPDESAFEVVLLESFVRHDGADAVLAESAWLDAQLAEYVEDWAEDVAVALEFYDDERSDVGLLACLHIVEVDIIVDGQSFCLAIVDERDAVELVAYGWVYVCQTKMYAFLQELFVAAFACYLLAGHLDALLLRAAVVVLRLYFEEVMSLSM